MIIRPHRLVLIGLALGLSFPACVAVKQKPSEPEPRAVPMPGPSPAPSGRGAPPNLQDMAANWHQVASSMDDDALRNYVGICTDTLRSMDPSTQDPESMKWMRQSCDTSLAELARRGLSPPPPGPTPTAAGQPETGVPGLFPGLFGPALSAPPRGTESAAVPTKQARARGEVLAVFDIEDVGKGLGAGEGDQLTEYFAVQLSMVGFKVVPRSQLRERLSAEKEESYKGCYDESCQIDLGKAVAAQKSVASKLLKIGSSCALTATLYDLRTETTEVAASVETKCTQGELFGGFKELAQQLVQP